MAFDDMKRYDGCVDINVPSMGALAAFTHECFIQKVPAVLKDQPCLFYSRRCVCVRRDKSITVCVHKDFSILVMSLIPLLIMIRGMVRNLDIHILVYTINIRIPVSKHFILFVQAPVMFISYSTYRSDF